MLRRSGEMAVECSTGDMINGQAADRNGGPRYLLAKMEAKPK
jgi:hypothetical protein